MRDRIGSDVAALVEAARAEADAVYEKAARCPGCDTPTQLVSVTRGTGADRWHESVPVWCTKCHNERIRSARSRMTCECDDPDHDHEETDGS